jgi:spore coat polysaccharide biosynthesis predicted glycosyltransferase SpsG
MLVVDDPTEAAVTPWIRAARRLGMPVATIHDLGLGAAGGDLVIDGSLGGPWRRWPTGRTLTGPRYAIVDRRLATVRLERVVGPGGKVLIALGGGPRRRLAARLAAAVLREVPAAHVTIAGGLLPATTQADPRITWLSDPQAFADTLAHATVAVVAGGVTLYESCAAGTPRVALAVVPAQRRTVEAFARAGAAIDAGGPLAGARTRRDVDHVAGLVADVVRDKNVRARLSKTGRRLIDGRGLARVVAELERLYRDGAEKVARG